MYTFQTLILMTNTLKITTVCSKPTTSQMLLGAKYVFVRLALKITMEFIYKNSFTSSKIPFWLPQFSQVQMCILHVV